MRFYAVVLGILCARNVSCRFFAFPSMSNRSSSPASVRPRERQVRPDQRRLYRESFLTEPIKTPFPRARSADPSRSSSPCTTLCDVPLQESPEHRGPITPGKNQSRFPWWGAS